MSPQQAPREYAEAGEVGLGWGSHGVAPSGIIHIGAHHGEEASYYRAQGVRRVVWIEAEPDAFEVLSRHVADYPGHHCIRALVTDREGEERPFFRHRFRGGAKRGFCSVLPLNQSVIGGDALLSRLETFEVTAMRTRTVAALLAEQGFPPDQFQYVAVNVQGAELMVLQGMREYLEAVQWVVCEAEARVESSRYVGAPGLGEIVEWMGTRGFHAVWRTRSRQQLFRRTLGPAGLSSAGS
jgi:FkbM family methyltransferase